MDINKTKTVNLGELSLEALENIGGVIAIEPFSKTEIHNIAFQSGMAMMATMFQYSFNDDGNLMNTNKEVIQVERVDNGS